MPPREVTADEVAFYQEHGYVIIRNFLTGADEIEHWRDAVMTAARERGPWSGGGAITLPTAITHPTLRGHPLNENDMRQWTTKPDTNDTGIFEQRVNLWMTNGKMRELMLDPELGKMACDLAQEKGMRIWHDQTLIKGPWGMPTAIHIDNPNWSYTSAGAISLWVALDDVSEKNGCLFFMPGSHRDAELGRQAGGFGNINQIFQPSDYPEWADREMVPMVLNAGDATFHSGMMAHAAAANMTPCPRRAMTCAYMPDGSTFNGKKNVLPDAYLENMKVGDVLRDDWINPLVYHTDPSVVLSREKIPEEIPVVHAGEGWSTGIDLLNGAGGVDPQRISSRL